MRTLYNPPQILKKIFPKFIWESLPDKVLLTFDDGPVPGTTESILKELQEHSVKAIFFCVGNNIKKYPSLAKEIISEGHTLANHTFNHKKVNQLSRTERIEEINTCSKIIQEKLSYEVKYFRPPHGRFNFKLVKELEEINLKNVMWSLLTYDFKNDIKLVRKASEKYLEKNSIVLLHDNKKSEDIIIDSINIILEAADRKNYLIGTPEECLK